MKADLQVLAWKMSSAGYGTDPVPTSAANVLLAQNVDINPLEMETDDYTPVSSKFGADEKIVGAVWCSMSFDMLLGGGGTPLGQAGTVPNHDPVLRAAGWARTLSAGVSTAYSQIDTGEEDAAMYFWMDSVLQKMLGIRGSASFVYEAKKAPRIRFKGMGLNVPMIDTALPTETLPTIPRPVAMNKANTVLTVGGYAARVSSFTIDQNNDVQYRNLTGREDVIIVGRQMAGKMSIELPLVAEKDFLGATGICTLATPVAMNVVHGTVAGNIVTSALTKVQLFNPKPKKEAGILMLDCDLHVVRNGMTLTYT
jgi:hypothetical protein